MMFYITLIICTGIILLIMIKKKELRELIQKYQRWNKAQEPLREAKRQLKMKQLDQQLKIESQKAQIRIKQSKLNKLRQKGRPKPTRNSTNPFGNNPFGNFNTSEERTDYFKRWK